MFRGTIWTASRQQTGGPTWQGKRYTIYVFDEALVLAPVDSLALTRGLASQIPVAGTLIGWMSDAAKEDRKAELEHVIEELPSEITVEELGQRIENAHAVPTAKIAGILLTRSFWADKPYMEVRFVSRDVDRYAYDVLKNRTQWLVSDLESAKALLNPVFGDRLTDK